MKKVAIIMESDSDLPVVKGAINSLKCFGIPLVVHVISAHRTPETAREFASTAREQGFGVMIAADSNASHLAGTLAAYTTLPVIAIPCKSEVHSGLESLLSSVKMPSGVPVATVAIDDSENAGILAAQILGVQDDVIREKLEVLKRNMAEDIAKKDEKLQTDIWWKL